MTDTNHDHAQVGIAVVTHGGAGAAMLAALDRMLGTAALAGFVTVAVEPGDTRDAIVERVRAAAHEADHGAGVVVACDLFGSTPGNCALQLMHAEPGRTVLFGVNLAMLVKLATASRVGVTPAALAHAAAETAIRSIREEGVGK